MEPNDESIENAEEISPEDAEKVTGGGSSYGASQFDEV